MMYFILRILNLIGKLAVVVSFIFVLCIPFIAISNCDSSHSKKSYSSKPYNRYQKNKQSIRSIQSSTGKVYVKKDKYNRFIDSIIKADIDNIALRYAPELPRKKAKTPDDAESEGYDAGYRDGLYDIAHNNEYGYHYNEDDTYFYGYYKTRYVEGYREGYNAGYEE